MRTRAWGYFGACLLLLAAASNAPAAVLYSQPLKQPIADRGPFSENGGNQHVADQFTLTQNATVTGLSWVGSYHSVDLGPAVTSVNFLVNWFADAAGLPGASIGTTQSVAASVTETGLVFEGRKLYSFVASLVTDVNVLASTTTWVSILEDSPASSYRWSTGIGPNTHAAVKQPFSGWNPLTFGERSNLAFDLLGDFELQPEPILPEPSSLALLALGACGLFGHLVRRRRV